VFTLIKGFYIRYEMTRCTDDRYLNLLYVDPANKHNITIIKEKEENFSKRFRECTVLLDKGYIDKFAEAMNVKGMEYVTVKRDNIVKSEHKRHYYQLLSRVRRIIETRFAQLRVRSKTHKSRFKKRPSSQDNPIYTILQHTPNDERSLMGTG